MQNEANYDAFFGGVFEVWGGQYYVFNTKPIGIICGGAMSHGFQGSACVLD